MPIPTPPAFSTSLSVPRRHHVNGSANIQFDSTRISRVSPDELYLCSLICTKPTSAIFSAPYRYQYLKMSWQRPERRNGDQRYFAFPLQKSVEVAFQSSKFSASSELFILRGTHIYQQQIVYSYQVSMILEVSTPTPYLSSYPPPPIVTGPSLIIPFFLFVLTSSVLSSIAELRLTFTLITSNVRD